MDEKQTSIPIAIVGMGCRYPGADTPLQLWTNILSRRRQFRRMPKCRLPLEDYFHEDKRVLDKTYSQMAAVIDGFNFDWAARRIPKITYESTDIVHWLALETALQAIADAGYTRETLPGKATGVIIGNSLTGEQSRSHNLRLRWPYVRKAFLGAAYHCQMPAEEIGTLEKALEANYKSAFPTMNEDSLGGGLSNTIAGRICNYLNLDGGGYTVDGACSSSLLAIITAVSGLTTGDLDVALAGGVDISLDPFELVGFSKVGALTSGEMTVYDRRASGFLPGEGCGFVVLKRHSDAIRDGNDIYAVIRGCGISSDGSHAAITSPSVPGQSLALNRAYEKAGCNINAVQFIEGHGTGTAVGDKIELEAIASLFTDDVGVQKNDRRSCGVTSLKSIIGHTKAASGIGGFIKSVMAVNRRICPPTAGCRYPSRVFDESAQTLYPIQTGQCLLPNENIQAGVSAMGFGGINSHITLESAGRSSSKFEPAIEERALMASAQENELFVFSAKNHDDLAAKCQQLAKTIKGISYAELTDLAFDLSNKLKSQDKLRAAFIARTPENLVEKLHKLNAMITSTLLSSGQTYHDSSEGIWIGKPKVPPRIGFLFPGQGSQKLDMARVLVERFQWARDLVYLADGMSKELGAMPISQMMFRDIDQARNKEQIDAWFLELSQTANAQPAICLSSILWCRFLEKLGITPMAIGGHSLGEATAFYAAGAYDETTLLRFAYRRGQAMGLPQQNAGAMLSLQCTEEQIKILLEKIQTGMIALANINAPNQMVASGEDTAVNQLNLLAKSQGIITRHLPVSNAFHCSLIQPAADQLAGQIDLPEMLGQLPTRLFSCMDGKEVTKECNLQKHFVQQVTAQVNFVALVESMVSCSDIIVEVGPGRVLSGLVDAITPRDTPVCLPTESLPFQASDLNGLLAQLYISGQPINWKTLYANRQVHPFVLPEDRLFLSNPCENPMKIEMEETWAANISDLPPLEQDVDMEPGTLADGSNIEVLYKLVEEVTGFPPQTLTLNCRLLDTLNLDSIKSGELIARYAQHFGLSGIIDPAELTNASLGEIADLVAHTSLDQTDLTINVKLLESSDVLTVLIDEVSKINNCPASDISADALVESDLYINEDQLHVILTIAAKKMGLELNLDLNPLLHRNLTQISQVFTRIANAGKSTMSSSNLNLSHTWVRDLRVDLIEKELPQLPNTYGKRAEDQWSNAKILILRDNTEDKISKAICKHLGQLGATVQVSSFDTMQNKEDTETINDFSHFIAILPRRIKPSIDIKKDLNRIIQRLSFAAVPPPASQGPRRRNCLAFVQFGTGNFGTSLNSESLDLCCATALAKSVYLERKDLKTRVIDFDLSISEENIAQNTILELQSPENFVEAGYDQHLTRCIAQANVIEPALYKKDTIAWSKKDVILVTGGAKGITAECAFALAQSMGAKMALIGRSQVPDSSSAGQDKSTISEILDRYEGYGLQARYYSCDVCDRYSVSKTIARIQEEMGQITGVIHGAGQNTPRLFSQVSTEEALEEISPKVIGALNLLEELRQTPPKIIIGLTSIIGVSGMQGNGWYAFSNEALNLILSHFSDRHPDTRTLSVAYSIWKDDGMGARMGSVQALKQQGIDAIPTPEGVRRFVHLFSHNPGTQQVIVTARMPQMDTLITQKPETINGARFLEKQVHFTPGVEAGFLVHLSFDNDLYLKDHCYNDSYLFPAVFGLEAMAQVAAYIIDITEFKNLQVENLELRRPIIVGPEQGVDILVWAQILERSAPTDKMKVKAGIFKIGADASEDFFSVTFSIDAVDSTGKQVLDFPQEPLDLNPSEDLYRDTLLFQGPRFQRIDQVYLLERHGEASGTVIVSTPPSDPEYQALAFANPDHRTFLLGDPFQRDNLLQSAALLIPQDTSLPMAIQSWDIFPRTDISSEKCRTFIRTQLVSYQDQEVETSVEAIDSTGLMVENITGYRLKILKHHDEYPTVTDLLVPDDRDTRLLQGRFSDLTNSLGLKPSFLNISFLPGLHDLSKDLRQELERPLINKTIEMWGKQNHVNVSGLKIQWHSSGKPQALIRDKTLDISLSHDNLYCLTTVGTESVGCDLAPVTHRTYSQWISLLGPLGKTEINELLSDSELDRRGTALWAVREVLHKLDIHETIVIDVETHSEDSLLFRCVTDKGTINVLTFWAVLTRGEERVIAMSANNLPAVSTSDVSPDAKYPGYESLLSRQHYRIAQEGPQGQMVFIHSFPITFMPAGQLSRHVYYSHYFFWAGEAREASAWPVLKQLTDQLSTGKWGGVTNFAALEILGEATTHDLVEVRMWASNNGGSHNSVLDMTYDFRKVLPGGGYERLALLDLQVTWVEILSHGVAKVAAYPEYYGKFIDQMLPRYDAPNVPEPIVESLKELSASEDEPCLYTAPAGPIIQPTLFSQIMETSLEDANIVGNIYFAHYYAWQGRVRDSYFYNLIPEYFQGIGDKGELICLNCRADHLREAMPFDRIEVRMALKALKTCHATLHFEYFKLDPQGKAPMKLATGKQEVVWVQRNKHKKPVPAPFPSAVQKAFKILIKDQSSNPI